MTSLISVAVRWDGYSALGTYPDPTAQAQTGIGYADQNHNAPWFADLITNNYLHSIESQANMDTELQLAQQAGVTCWAYNWYQPESTKPMMAAWRLHQASGYKNDVNWCVLDDPGGFLGTGVTFAETELWQAQMAVWVGYFAQSNYQKVLENQPLVFILWSDAEITGSYGGDIANYAAMVTYLNGLCATAGLGNVYMVLQGQPADVAPLISQTGASAIGSYTMGTTVILQPTDPYTNLDVATQAEWVTYANQGVDMVPTLMTGFSPRPERSRPFTWQLTFQTPFLYYSKDFAAPTPTQFGAHVAAGIAFTEANLAVNPAGLMFIYAWSECSESGNPLIPTQKDPPVNTDSPDPIPTSNLLIATGAQLRTVA